MWYGIDEVGGGRTPEFTTEEDCLAYIDAIITTKDFWRVFFNGTTAYSYFKPDWIKAGN